MFIVVLSADLSVIRGVLFDNIVALPWEKYKKSMKSALNGSAAASIIEKTGAKCPADH